MRPGLRWVELGTSSESPVGIPGTVTYFYPSGLLLSLIPVPCIHSLSGVRPPNRVSVAHSQCRDRSLYYHDCSPAEWEGQEEKRIGAAFFLRDASGRRPQFVSPLESARGRLCSYLVCLVPAVYSLRPPVCVCRRTPSRTPPCTRIESESRRRNVDGKMKKKGGRLSAGSGRGAVGIGRLRPIA